MNVSLRGKQITALTANQHIWAFKEKCEFWKTWLFCGLDSFRGFEGLVNEAGGAGDWRGFSCRVVNASASGVPASLSEPAFLHDPCVVHRLLHEKQPTRSARATSASPCNQRRGVHGYNFRFHDSASQSLKNDHLTSFGITSKQLIQSYVKRTLKCHSLFQQRECLRPGFLPILPPTQPITADRTQGQTWAASRLLLTRTSEIWKMVKWSQPSHSLRVRVGKHIFTGKSVIYVNM